ncbi:ParA family protein [Paenibacillus barcinonensis]|uniref:ParA family protein n=1 Tax=Paenibacillus barcinonensis TaxID=198119 RepID=UPI001C115330|nr:ParA family protein [Paenibacillus barcinonensis]MBU5353184.1 ParA family protein [Paenibacillus barcinonensis]
MKVITFFNNKGGVGKTTLAVNVASFIATQYKNKNRILFLDADPQANSTQMMIPDEMWGEFYGYEAKRSTIMNYLTSIEEGNSDVVYVDVPFKKGENRFGVDLIPGHPSLAIIEDILSDGWNKCISGDLGGFRKTNWLSFIKEHFKDSYDYIFIDVGPSLGALNRSILVNTDYIITPMGSDIFSLIGISNMSTWMRNWMNSYRTAIGLLHDKHNSASIEKYSLNLQIDKVSRLVGFSIQQYVTKTFKEGGRRPIASYDTIIKNVPEAIETHLQTLIKDGLTVDDLNLGDIPYLYSLVPLAQTSKAPMYNLTRVDGVVGGQTSSVKKYKEMIQVVCDKIRDNIGDTDAS